MKYINRSLWTLLLIALTACGMSTNANAQTIRSNDGVYVRQHFGLSSYLGDNEQSPINFNLDAFEVDNKVPFSLGAELGYQFSSNFGLGLGYQLGDYPVIFQVNEGVEQYEQVNTLRHTGALLGRYTIMGHQWQVAPYLEVGAHASYSNAERLSDEWSYGPSAGLGLDIAVSDQTSILLGWTSHFSVDDSSIDMQGDGGFGDFDMLNALTLGMKHNFRSPFIGVDVHDIEGPDMLEVGETGIFSANANIEAATPPFDYTWRFGDGETSDGLVSRHAFDAPGTYTVTFTAENSGSDDTESMSVTVVEAAVPADIINISTNPTAIEPGTEVTFRADVMGDAPLQYTWSFGDGTTATEATPTHTFTEPGTYMVSLNLSNEAGFDNETRTLAVTVDEPAFCATITEMNVVFFERNSSVLTAEGAAMLRDNAEVLAECPNIDATLRGSAAPDERGGEALAEDRARSVRNFYVENGVSADRLSTEGYVASGSAKMDGSQHRRVVTDPEF